MNNTSDQNSKQRNDHSADFIPAASHYALKLAFQTLKERFEKQQNRITALEEENLKLKEIKCNTSVESNQCTNVIELEKKIDELSRQKSQLSHHIFMLATENKNHWDSISKLNEEKKILLDQIRELNSKLDSIDSTKMLLKNTPFILQDGESSLCDSVKENTVETTAEDDDKDSLVSIETVKDLSLNDKENKVDLYELNNELKEIVDKFKENKNLLRKQQAGLKEALDSVKKIYKGLKIYSRYLKNLKTEKSSSAEEEIEGKDNLESLDSSLRKTAPEVGDSYYNSDELICPFCCKLFVKNTAAKEYHEHFILHVQDCSDDNESVLKSFEIIV
ncbi:hypothetical protein O3M35_010373 [Rhynocoris fuscipes]|uniref:UBZ1-type domain-containing protein n=1 Tax=Rhynocoris fuscipes TaxID=488301 RepID=A0AAW1D043_9HEMI